MNKVTDQLSRTGKELKNCLVLEEEALKLGCTASALVWAGQVRFDPRVTLKCRQNLCSHYGMNFMCPPYAPGAEEFARAAARFNICLLVRKETDLPPGFSTEEGQERFKEVALFINKVIVQLEKQAFGLGFPYSLGLIGGNCKLCEVCAAKEGGSSCRQPGMARSSLEAVGIDVLATCEASGFPVAFTKQRVGATGLLYIV